MFLFFSIKTVLFILFNDIIFLNIILNGDYMNKKNFLVYFISILLIAIAIGIMVSWQSENNESAELTNSIYEITTISEIPNENINDIDIANPPEENQETRTYLDFLGKPLIDVDLNELVNKNSDTVAWIKVNGTDINYPVVQTDNNDYYLNHSFNNNSNSSGWIFADYRNDLSNLGRNTIIYGHNRMNNTMFATLNTLLSDDWYNNRDWCIHLSTLNKNTLWQIFSVYKVPSESYYITTDFEDSYEYLKFLETILNRSYYNFETDLNINDKILTLSTCTNVNDGRLVVHAKLIKSANK